MVRQYQKLMYAVTLTLLAAWLLSACATPPVVQQPNVEADQPVVTVYKTPT